MTDFNQNCIGRWTFRKRNAAGLFVNEMQPGTGDLTPKMFVGDDSEIVDTDYGQGLILNGAKRLNAGSGGFCNFTIQQFSIEWFVFFDSSAALHYLISKWVNLVDGYAIRISNNGSGTIFLPPGVAVDIPVGTFPMDRFVHCVVTASDLWRVYIDGVVAFTSVVAPVISDSSANDLYIYSVLPHQPLTGYCGPVRIWEGRALSAADVWELYTLGPNRT